jgi:glycosyltransferase involved in cell wall biosynthesis
MNIVLHEMGTYTHRQELARALSSRGHEIASGKPILAAIPADNLVARTISAASAGMTVDPEDLSELRRLARSLIEDKDRCRRLGAAGLAYARANFDINSIAARFENIFRDFARPSDSVAQHEIELDNRGSSESYDVR